MKKMVLVGMVAGFSLLGVSGGALADMDYDYVGAFTRDNDVLQIDFTIDTERDVTFFTSSWADGGFDPLLSLWNGAGEHQGEWDDAAEWNAVNPFASWEELSKGVSYEFGASDVYYVHHLSAGSYSVTITQFENSSATFINLDDGFFYDTDPLVYPQILDDPNRHYTYVNGYGQQQDFNGTSASPDPRTGLLVFHVLDVTTAEIVRNPNPVPVPASLLLFGSALAGLIGVKRRK